MLLKIIVRLGWLGGFLPWRCLSVVQSVLALDLWSHCWSSFFFHISVLCSEISLLMVLLRFGRLGSLGLFFLILLRF